MPWDPAFTPDAPTGAPPTWDQAFTPDTVPNPHSTGQLAEQTGGDKPVTAQPPLKVTAPSQKANLFGTEAEPPVTSAPATPSTEESSMAATDLLPSQANPAAAERLRNVNIPIDPADIASIKTAQTAALNQKIKDVSDALGGVKFDPSRGDNSTWQRARMGFMGSQADRAAYLKSVLPPGSDVQQLDVPGVGPITVFKRPGDTAYSPVRGSDDVAGRVGDMLAAAPSVATQAATAAATNGETLLYRLFAQALTGAGERGAELGGNYLAGNNTGSAAQNIGDAAQSGGTGMAAELGGSALSLLTKTAAKPVAAAADAIGLPAAAATLRKVGEGAPGIFKPTAEGADRLAAESALKDYDPNLRTLTAFQLGHPLLEQKGQRLAAINPTIANIGTKQKSTLADLLSKSVGDATGGTTPAIGDNAVQVGNVSYPGLQGVVSGMKDEAAAPLKDIPQVSPVIGGQAFQQGANDLKDTLSARTSDKFNTAFDAARDAPNAPNGVVPFDLTKPQAVAADVTKPVIGQGVPKDVQRSEGYISPETHAYTTAHWEETNPTEVPIGGVASPIAKVVDQLRALNPQNGVGPMTENTDAPYDALKALRNQLNYAAEYPGAAATPEAKAASYQARKIIKPLDESLVNPGEGAPSDFVPKMKSAQNAAKFQGKVLDNPDMQTAMHTPYPEDVMKLADPGNATFLKMAQRTMDPERYQKFQDAYATALIREPEKLSGLMNAYRKDPSVLDRLISPQNQGLLKQYGIDMDNIGKSLPSKLSGQNDFSARARSAFDGSSGSDLTDLVQRGGGQDSPIGQNLRGALFKHVLDNSMDDAGKLDMNKATRAITAIMKDGKAAAVLNQEELKRLNDIRTYASGVATTHGGVGAGMYGSETAGAALTPTNILLAPHKFLKSLGELAEARFQNWSWTSEHGKHFLVGGGQAPIKPIRAGAAGYGAYENDQSRQEPDIGGR